MKNGKSDCPFCSSEIQNRFVSSNELVFAIYDQYPVSNGHLLVIPNRHCDNYFLLSVDEQQACWSLIKEMQEKIETIDWGIQFLLSTSKIGGKKITRKHIRLKPSFASSKKSNTRKLLKSP